MIEKPKLIEIDDLEYSKLFSMCILTSRQDELESVTTSAYTAGFTNENTEYLYINNINKNKYNAYDGLNQFLNKASGKYIILVHQDIVFEFDNIDILIDRIKQMDKVDPKWAILGNAGYSNTNVNRQFTRITDPGHTNQNDGPFPAQVGCIDEDIMIVKNDLNLMFSKNIGHYHLYGADLCLQASMQGLNSYIIDFHVRHKSGGFPNQSFYDTKERFIEQYSNLMKPKFIRTPCTFIYLSNNKYMNFIMNTKFIYSLKKRYDTIKNKFTKQLDGNTDLSNDCNCNIK